MLEGRRERERGGMRVLAHNIQRNGSCAQCTDGTFGLDLGVIDERDNSSIINTSMLVHLPRIRYLWWLFRNVECDPDEAKERSIRREISKGIS